MSFILVLGKLMMMLHDVTYHGQAREELGVVWQHCATEGRSDI